MGTVVVWIVDVNSSENIFLAKGPRGRMFVREEANLNN